MKQLAVPHKFSIDNFREGLLLILWGLFQKIVIADRIATFVDVVYANYTTYQGAFLIAFALAGVMAFITRRFKNNRHLRYIVCGLTVAFIFMLAAYKLDAVALSAEPLWMY